MHQFGFQRDRMKFIGRDALAQADANVHIASHQRRNDPETAWRDPFFVPHIFAL